MLLQITLFGAVVAAMTKPTWGQAKLDCQDKCGNVSIPYPFGMTDNCYYNEDFLITCNETFNPPKPFLGDGNIPITNISINGQLHVMHYVAEDCYDQFGRREHLNNPWISFDKLRVSSTENKFTAIGCDTYANITGYKDNKSYVSGCMLTCSSMDYISNGSCSGIGCCQISIPEGLNSIEVAVNSYKNHKEVWNFNPCSYAFVMEEDKFNFSSANLSNLRNVTELPMVIDWAIWNVTCEVAKNSSEYACMKNSMCYNVHNGAGYGCRCLEGYRGNAYLPDGCQDIDECEEGLNQCTMICTIPRDITHVLVLRGTTGMVENMVMAACVIDHRFRTLREIMNQGMREVITVTISVLLLGGSWLYWGFRQRKIIKLREKFFEQNGGIMLQQNLPKFDTDPNGTIKLFEIFTEECLKKATNDYHESRILGQGGHGTVYKGIFPDEVVAIKKSKIGDKSEIEQFINEVIILSQINHTNIVKLRGCCLETQVPLLVYEFVNNGTLYDHLHTRSHHSSPITWENRLRIATETAEVLSYLHSSANTHIIHRDIKSNNILLDDKYTAKVSDFGASRLFPTDQTQLTTLARKKERNLAAFFVSSMKEDRLFDIVHEHVMNEEKAEQLKEVAILAKRCLEVKGDERPTMKEVAIKLEGLRMMEKHSWANDNRNSKHTQDLIGDLSDACGDGASSSSISAACDSMTNHAISPLDDGR
ncbi:wall associated kinase 5 [Actinidia rufa]|uniref:Wall associated kinase 5 n=1 Tax=Actinidia rufa TaxID=165716 RepID=A0A7J0DHW9_9ERIC|nr:wall associated kinase 5 [Actinidia rufa]